MQKHEPVYRWYEDALCVMVGPLTLYIKTGSRLMVDFVLWEEDGRRIVELRRVTVISYDPGTEELIVTDDRTAETRRVRTSAIASIFVGF